MKMRVLLLTSLTLLSACDYIPSWMGGEEKEIVRLPGVREDVLKVDSTVQPDALVQQMQFSLPSVTENTNWAQHTGQFSAATGNLALPGGLKGKLSATIGEGNEYQNALVPRPVVADGKVFVMDGAGVISAHDVVDVGRKIWNSEALADLDDEDVMGGGLAFDGGKVYALNGEGKIAVLDASDGRELWKRNLGIPLRSAPRIDGGKLFIITIDSQLFALDAASGTTLWSHRGIGETAGLMNSVSPAIAADAVIAPYASGELYALDKETGDEKWRASLAQSKRTEATAIFSGIGGDPVVDEQVVFAVSSSGLFSAFSLLNGQPVWDAKIASINTPWLVGDYVFVLTEDNVLMAMVKYDGRIRWTSQLKRFKDEKRSLRPIVWRGPVMAGGKLVVVSTYGDMLVIDPASGAVSETIEVPDHIVSAPVVAAGKLLLVDKEATLYSYQ